MLHVPGYGVVVVGRRKIGIVDREAHVVREFHPRTDLQRALCTQVVFLISLVTDLVDTLGVIQTAGNVIVGVLVSAGDGDIVLGRPVVVAVELLEPVVAVVIGVTEVRNVVAFLNLREVGPLPPHDLVIDRLRVRSLGVDVVQEGLGSIVIAVVGCDPPVEPLVRIRNAVINDGPAVDGQRTVVVDHRSPLLRILRRYEDDTEGTAGTVDRRRRSILQDGDTLDILRIDHTEVSFHTVDQHERRTAGTDGTGTTDIERTVVGRLAVMDRDVQTGNLALQGAGQVGIGTVADHLAADLVDGTDKITALHRRITDDNRLVQDVTVSLKGNHKRLCLIAGQDNLLVLVTDIRDNHRRRETDAFHGEGAVDIGNETGRRSLDHDTRPDERVPIGIQHLAAEISLGGSHEREQQHYRPKHQDFDQ